MVVVHCRNMKLFLNKGSCVLTDSKQHVFKHSVMYCTQFHTAFNVLNILIGIGHIKEWRPHIITIIYTLLILQLPECIQPKQSLAPHPPTPSIHHNFSEPPTNSLLLLPGTCSTFCHDCRLPQHCSVASEISSKTLKNFLHFQSTTSYQCKLQTVLLYGRQE
jgi:hypothetical protein